MRASLRYACALFALSLVAPLAFAEDYAITLDRPDKAGFKYRVTEKVTMKRASSLSAGQTLLSTSADLITIDFASEETVLDVDDRGDSTKCSYKIAKCTVTAGSAARELLPAGTEVVASIENGEQVFRVNDAVFSSEVSKALNEVVDLSNGQPSYDDVFGTTERKKVGDSWPVNSALMAADLSKEGPAVKPEDITGTVKLVGLAQIDGIPCLEVTTELSLKLTTAQPGASAPKGFTFSSGSIAGFWSGTLPIDTSLRASDFSDRTVATRRYLSNAATSGGPRQTLERIRTRTIVEKYEPLN